MKIADLLDILGNTCDLRSDIREVYLRVQSDSNFLVIKPRTDRDKWYASYREVFGYDPTQELFRQNADAAVRSAEELVTFERTLTSISPDAYEAFVRTASELLRRLKEYRNSIPTYFSSP